MCDSKKSKFIKEKETSWLLSALTIKATSIIISLVSPLLFSMYKINEIVNKFLLAWDTFMLGRNLRQPTAFEKWRFKYSACGRFTKNEKVIQKFRETGDS